MRELSLHILDIAENSLKAGATEVDIEVVVSEGLDRLTIAVRDNGRGMPAEMVARVADPFTTTRTERRVGLGIPLLAAACEQTGGKLSIESEPGKGTSVTAVFGLSSVDRAPMGALAETVANLAAGNPGVRIRFEIETAEGAFSFDSKAIEAELDGVPINSPEVALWMKGYLEEGIDRVCRPGLI